MLSLHVLRETAISNLPVPPQGRTFPRQLGGDLLSDDKKGGGDGAARNCGVCVPVHERERGVGREGGEGERKECILWLGMMVTKFIRGLHRAVLETQSSLVC